MNIFIFDEVDIKQCAQWHCDRHVVKMIVETAQLLSTANRIVMGDEYGDTHGLYKKTHENHPCNIWARSSKENYTWLAILGIELCEEYTYRYGKTHITESMLNFLLDNVPNIEPLALTPFAQAMPEQYKNTSAQLAYQAYFNGEKQHIASWKFRSTPPWFVKQAQETKETKKIDSVLSKYLRR